MLLGLCFCLHNCSIHELIARVEADVNWPSHPICLIVQHFHCSGSSCAVICNTRIFTLYDLSHRSIYISHPQSFLSPLLLCAFKPAKSSDTLPEQRIYNSYFKPLFLLYEVNDQMPCQCRTLPIDGLTSVRATREAVTKQWSIFSLCQYILADPSVS